MITYDPFWETMKKKNITSYALVNKYKFSGATLSRLRNNKGVSTNTVGVLCDILDCNVDEILNHKKNN